MRVRVSAFVCLIAIAAHFLCIVPAVAECRRVGPSDKIRFDPATLRDLTKSGITRQLIFDAVKDVSIPETEGCWGGATGNFDGQIVSAGVMQLNYGQKSLQPLLRKYKESFRTQAAFQKEIKRLMPQYGRLVFSPGCLNNNITDDCKAALLKLQSDSPAAWKAEFNALFESDQMIQVQMDQFVSLLESVRDDLRRMFGDHAFSVRRIKWAIDTKTQQGGFPKDGDIARMRATWKDLGADERRSKINSIVQWYEALCNAVDQDGVKYDWRWNVDKWRSKIADSLTDEQAELINLTFLRSRTAQGQSGRWQANTFQRRATIVFGVGSIARHRIGS